MTVFVVAPNGALTGCCTTFSPEWMTPGNHSILEVQSFDGRLNLSQVDLYVTDFLEEEEENYISASAHRWLPSTTSATDDPLKTRPSNLHKYEIHSL